MKHRLNNSTLLNNYGAIHLINDVNLLKSKSVKQTELSECIKTSTTTFIIQAIKRRIIYNLIVKKH